MIYETIVTKRKLGKKQVAVLVDPDRSNTESLMLLVEEANSSGLDYFFVGGSLMVTENLESSIRFLKKHSRIPVVLFPGSPLQVNASADAILFLSLISGRNAETLIGQQVIAAPYIKRTGIEVLSTGYMLIDAGKPTTVSYMSNSLPIPNDKPEIAVCTAMAGEMLGLKLIYLDAGSGALQSVSTRMVSDVRKNIKAPLIVGGGVKSEKQAKELFKAGADVLVVGNAIEKNPLLIKQICNAAHRHFQHK